MSKFFLTSWNCVWPRATNEKQQQQQSTSWLFHPRVNRNYGVKIWISIYGPHDIATQYFINLMNFEIKISHKRTLTQWQCFVISAKSYELIVPQVCNLKAIFSTLIRATNPERFTTSWNAISCFPTEYLQWHNEQNLTFKYFFRWSRSRFGSFNLECDLLFLSIMFLLHEKCSLDFFGSFDLRLAVRRLKERSQFLFD